MKNFSEDELDDVKPQAAKAAAPAQTAAAAPAKAQTKAAVVEEEDLDDPKPAAKGTVAAAGGDDNLDVDFGDEKLANRPNQLPRCRPSEKGKAVRFALLPFIKPKSAKNHFVELPQ